MLPMVRLRALCEEAGFRSVKTYIQSGNVVFESKLAEAKVKATLEKVLAKELGKPFGALVRTCEELEAVAEENPFPKAAPNRVLVVFLDEPPPKNALAGIVAPGGEQLKLGRREIYVHYPDGMGQSKLKLPQTKTGTGRNLNTVRKLATMARELADGSK